MSSDPATTSLTPDLIQNYMESMRLQIETLKLTVERQQEFFESRIATLTQELRSSKPGIEDTPPVVDTSMKDSTNDENQGENAAESGPEPPKNSATSPPQRVELEPEPVPRSTRQLSEKLPDPEPFTGRRKTLTTFLLELRFKLEGNADRYNTPRSQFLYAVSRIKKEAADLIHPLLDKELGTLSQLLEFLEATYGDPYKKSNAQARLEKLEQGKKSFLNHFAEFRRHAADADLNESAQIMQLRRSLSKDLKRAMVGEPIPDTLNAYANQILAYDNDLRYLDYKPSASTTYRPRHERHEAMDLDQVSTGYAPKDSAERERRKKLGLCFKCGSSKHISPNCTTPLPIPNTHVRAAKPRFRSDSRDTASTQSYPRSSRRSSRSSRGSPKNGSSRR